MLPDAQGQRPDAAQHQETLEGRHDAARRLLNEKKALLVLRCCADQRPAQPVGVAVQVFCRRMHHDIRAQRQRTLQHRRQKRVVHADLNAASVGDLAHRRNIGQYHQWIAGCFDVNQLGRGPDGHFHRLQVARIYILDTDAIAGDNAVEEAHRAGIHIFGTDQVVARL